jgi:hypothetical protein
MDMKYNSNMPRMKVDPESYVSFTLWIFPPCRIPSSALMANFSDGGSGWDVVSCRAHFETTIDAAVLRVLIQDTAGDQKETACWCSLTHSTGLADFRPLYCVMSLAYVAYKCKPLLSRCPTAL